MRGVSAKASTDPSIRPVSRNRVMMVPVARVVVSVVHKVERLTCYLKVLGTFQLPRKHNHWQRSKVAIGEAQQSH